MAKESNKTYEITKEILVSYIKKSGRELNNFLSQKRKELGSRYHERNSFELMKEKFGNPELVPDKFFDEFELIRNKASKQSSNIRKCIELVMQNSIDNLIRDYQQKAKEEQNTEKVKDGSKTRKDKGSIPG